LTHKTVAICATCAQLPNAAIIRIAANTLCARAGWPAAILLKRLLNLQYDETPDYRN